MSTIMLDTFKRAVVSSIYRRGRGPGNRAMIGAAMSQPCTAEVNKGDETTRLCGRGAVALLVTIRISRGLEVATELPRCTHHSGQTVRAAIAVSDEWSLVDLPDESE